MKSVLITGGCGFIGSHLSLFLKQKKYKVIVVDNLLTGKKNLFRGNKFYKTNLNNKKKLDKIFKKYNFEAVFHLAGMSKLTESFKKKKLYKKNNVLCTKNIIDLIVKYKVKYFIFSSSAAVYGRQKIFPINENAKLKPISYYGKTKLICENLIKKNSLKKKFKAICLRYFNVVGSNFKNKLGEVHSPPIHLIPTLVKSVLKNKPLDLRLNFETKDGSGIRDYVDVNDIVNAHYLSLIKMEKIRKSFIPINLGSRKSYSSKNILKLIQKEFRNKKIKTIFSKKKRGEPDKLLASSKLAKKILNWKPKKNISYSLKNMIAWEKYIIINQSKFFS